MPKLSRVQIAGFKRFSDLDISGLPETTRLVVLAGPNGFGKSSLFDAFRRWTGHNAGTAWRDDPDYFNRSSYLQGKETKTSENLNITLTFADGNIQHGSDEAKKAFYIRSAYRNDPELSIKGLSRVGSALAEQRIFRLIDNDATVTANYQRLVSDAFDNVFEKESGKTTLETWRESVIGDLRDAIARLFPGLILNGLGSPLRDPTFRFSKGKSESFLYKNLSGGEKAAFDLILDLIVKRQEYNDTIFCIDEPEVHTNPRIQGKFLRELLNLIPENCQMWISTHAIGMMREARDIEKKEPGSVAFLDFGGHDFDQPVVMKPTKPTRLFWESALSVALHDLAELVGPQVVVICEGNPLGYVAGKNAEHDARCYMNIFEDDYPEAAFVGGGNSIDVVTDRMGFAAKLPAIIQGCSVHPLIDRDDHGAAEIADLEKKGITVLKRRNIEAYLWDDEILEALCASRNSLDVFPEILLQKASSLAASVGRGYASDDLKPAAPTIYVFIKHRMGLVGEGNDARAFERNVLSKLFRPEMTVYQHLKKSIFD